MIRQRSFLCGQGIIPRAVFRDGDRKSGLRAGRLIPGCKPERKIYFPRFSLPSGVPMRSLLHESGSRRRERGGYG